MDREEVVIVLVRGGEIVRGREEGNVRADGGLEVWLPAGLDGGGLRELMVAAIAPGDVAREGLVCGGRQPVAFGRTGGEAEVVVKARNVSSFSVAGAAVAGANGIGEQGNLQGRAHQGPCGVWQVGCTGGGIGQHLAVGQTLSSYGGLVLAQLFLVLGLDHVE